MFIFIFLGGGRQFSNFYKIFIFNLNDDVIFIDVRLDGNIC